MLSVKACCDGVLAVDREVRVSMDDRELGRRIGYWRRRRKLTQAVFADRIGRSKSWVEKVERGERSAGRLSVLDGICEVLQVDLAALVGEEPQRMPQACLDDSEVERIRSSLERYTFDAPADSGPDMASLHRQLD
jgi:transcriptional regulator with XRE-family HTH domain